MLNSEKTMDKIVALAKNRGFILPGSDIYGGLANTWDYAPLGVELKRNIKNEWWKRFVKNNPYNVGMDASILMNPQVWVASGHVGGFSDPLMDCKKCKARFRADHLAEDFQKSKGQTPDIAGWSDADLKKFIDENEVKCPKCGNHDFTDIRKFNLMFKTFQGVTEDSQSEIYLRPETAQGIFVNFKAVQRALRKKIPFGMAQIGKSFRNEITPGNFIFRTREFEQMELEFFCEPGTELEWFKYWKEFCKEWLLDLGIKEENLKLRDHKTEELSHYSNATTDFEYLFPFGWGELWGVASRTDYDLNAHMKESGVKMYYEDPYDTSKKYVPYVIEPSLGVERLLLAILTDAYDEDMVGSSERVVLRLHPALAPYQAAIFPLTKKQNEGAFKLYESLLKNYSVDYDESGNIGKRYRRHDEIGTPFCFTYDEESESTQTVTIRYRDDASQKRVKFEEIPAIIDEAVRVGKL